MADVHWWLEPPNSPPGYHSTERWQGIVPGRPEINATAYNADDGRAFIVEAWNRETPDNQLTQADFNFINQEQ